MININISNNPLNTQSAMEEYLVERKYRKPVRNITRIVLFIMNTIKTQMQRFKSLEYLFCLHKNGTLLLEMFNLLQPH
jgi:hypothetical protein